MENFFGITGYDITLLVMVGILWAEVRSLKSRERTQKEINDATRFKLHKGWEDYWYLIGKHNSLCDYLGVEFHTEKVEQKPGAYRRKPLAKKGAK